MTGPLIAPPPTSNQPVRVSLRSYGAEARRESHPHLQLVLPWRGRLQMNIGGVSGYAGDDRLAIVPSGVEHAFFAQAPNQLLVVDLDSPDAVADGSERFAATTPAICAAAALLLAEARSGGLDDPLVADALGRYLLAALGRRGEEPRVANPTARRLARLAEEHLRAHFAQPLTVADVATTVGTSPSHLHRCFRAHTGRSVVAFIQHLRLEQAAELLRETDLSVLEVAHAVGFASQSHFSRLFVRQFGCPPGRYRTRI